MSKLVVCLTGMPGAGKSTIVSKLKQSGYETLVLEMVLDLKLKEKT